MTAGRRLGIYIHPEAGPISPMDLDLDAIEVAMNKVSETDSADEAAINEIARQIETQFEEVRPHDNRKQLAMLMRRWVNIQGFKGIVLQLPGTIRGNATGKSLNQQQSQELSQLADALEQKQRALANEQRAKEALHIRLHSLETESKRLKALYERAHNEVIDQRVQTKLGQEAIEQRRRTMLQAQEQARQATQQIAGLKVRIEQLQQELQARPSQAQYENELALLRNKERRARESEQQLREALASSQQENAALREQVRMLAETIPIEEIVEDDSDIYAL